MARRQAAEMAEFTLTAGVGGLSEKAEGSYPESFTLQATSFDSELMRQAGLAWLAARGYEGEVANPRVTADGVTANAEGRVSKRKGRVKVISEQYTGDLWVRDAKSTRQSARNSTIAQLRALLDEHGIDHSAIA